MGNIAQRLCNIAPRYALGKAHNRQHLQAEEKLNVTKKWRPFPIQSRAESQGAQ